MQRRLLSVPLRAASDSYAVVTAGVSVRLRHGCHHVDAATRHFTTVIATRAIVSMAGGSMVSKHGSSVLIGNGCLSHHHLLIFNEVMLTMATLVVRMVQAVRVVPVVSLDLAGVLFGAHGNHGTVRTVATPTVEILILLRLRRSSRVLRISDEHDVALIYGGVVRAAVRPLLVAPTQACTAAVV